MYTDTHTHTHTGIFPVYFSVFWPSSIHCTDLSENSFHRENSYEVPLACNVWVCCFLLCLHHQHHHYHLSTWCDFCAMMDVAKVLLALTLLTGLFTCLYINILLLFGYIKEKKCQKECRGKNLNYLQCRSQLIFWKQGGKKCIPRPCSCTCVII